MPSEHILAMTIGLSSVVICSQSKQTFGFLGLAALILPPQHRQMVFVIASVHKFVPKPQMARGSFENSFLVPA